VVQFATWLLEFLVTKKRYDFLKKNKREKSIRPTSKNKHKYKYKKRNRYKGEGNKQTFLMVKKNKN
jgi:hypothetical protein